MSTPRTCFTDKTQRLSTLAASAVMLGCLSLAPTSGFAQAASAKPAHTAQQVAAAPSNSVALGRPVSDPHVKRASAADAAQLLDDAVNYLRESPRERALAVFNNQAGRFNRADLYVYVLGADGVMLAHGGEPEGLVGLDVRGLTDASGKTFITEMMEGARRDGVGKITYQWLNRVSNRVEPKITIFRQVNDVIVAVGYYQPRATAEMARDLLEQAVKAIGIGKPQAEQAFKQFNDANSNFVRDDLYVFVVGLKDGRFHAMGASPQLTGTGAMNLRDAEGRAIIRDMIGLVQAKDQAEYDYVWRNPVTNKIEPKHSFVRKVGDYMVGVGTYNQR